MTRVNPFYYLGHFLRRSRPQKNRHEKIAFQRVQNRCRREGAEAEVAINGGESRRLLRISMKPQMLRADEARFGFSVQDFLH